MDEEETAAYREPCAQCAAVDWGVSEEGRFYCRSCHNVIERTREVVDPSFNPGFTRISTIGRGARTKRPERGRQWMVCEGFQFILRNQANALLMLGVRPHFKDQVLCPLWRLYLQQSRLAYSHKPATTSSFRVRGLDSDSDSAAESSVASLRESNPSSTAGSNAETSSDWSQCSGSMDAASYLSARLRRTQGVMSMKKTLALIHLALIWSREPLTLSDLLRLVNEGHVPYVNSYEELPEEMKLEGKDALIFKVESVPSHQAVHKEAQALAVFLQLPAFPPISRQSLLHPALLSLRYLTDTNLPDELHLWVCRMMERARMADETLHTFDAASRPVLPKYDMQTAALIIITMKLIFGLDDHTEWDLSNQTGDQDTGNMFNLRRWYRLLQATLIRVQQRSECGVARKQWKTKKPLISNVKERSIVLKKRRVAEQLQLCFEKLSGRPAGFERVTASSFRFCWGDEDGADGPSLHHKTLDGVLTQSHEVQTLMNSRYWHPALKACDPRLCSSHYSEVEPTLPRMFVWLLQLFSFLLDVRPPYLYEEVLMVERRVFGSKTPETGTRIKNRTRIGITWSRSRTGTRSRSRTRSRRSRSRTRSSRSRSKTRSSRSRTRSRTRSSRSRSKTRSSRSRTRSRTRSSRSRTRSSRGRSKTRSSRSRTRSSRSRSKTRSSRSRTRSSSRSSRSMISSRTRSKTHSGAGTVTRS